jgi:hypothetical protein
VAKKLNAAKRHRVKRSTRGGYTSGGKLVSQLAQPPKGPAVGAKPSKG